MSKKRNIQRGSSVFQTAGRNVRLVLYVFFAILLLCGRNGYAQIPDSVPEDYVVASLIVADPGDVLYSRVGHVALHMQCPTHNLDYVFSYEAEPVKGQVVKFLAGNLKMGLFAIPLDEYLDIYRPEGRGVREYQLNLPIKVKQNLWRILDNHLMEGSNLPYDYLQRGCAHSALMMLKEGLDTIPIEYGEWPETFNLSRRELTGLQLKSSSSWTWCFLNLIGNGSIDRACSNEEKIIMPADLVEVLSHAQVCGQPLMKGAPTVLLESSHHLSDTGCSPLCVAVLLLVLTLVAVLMKKQWMDYVLVAIQTLLGLLTVYLVVFSDLCCTEWSWLIIPFNPLPLIFWKWRKQWSLPYAVILALWCLVMAIYPHQLTDPTYIALTLALIVSYWGMYRRNRQSSLVSGKQNKRKTKISQ